MLKPESPRPPLSKLKSDSTGLLFLDDKSGKPLNDPPSICLPKAASEDNARRANREAAKNGDGWHVVVVPCPH